MAPAKDIGEVVAALATWPSDSAPLIGVFESQELEFKKTGYPLSEASGKSEFAKDIAGMANAGGGLIVLGIDTVRDTSIGRDKSVEVRPIAAGIVDLSQMEEVARIWIYPPQRGLEIIEWPDLSSGQMLISIRVPGVTDMGGLAVVLGPGTPPDRRTIGVPLRSASRVDFHTAAEIYDWIRRGRLQSAIGADSSPARHTADDADAQLQRMRSEYVEASAAGESVFYLQAWPGTETRLEHLQDLDGVRGLFLNPPKQRYGGFGWWGLQPETDRDGGIRVSGDAISFWVTPSGVATAVISQDYLTWAMERYGSGPLINSIALGEITYEFCRAFLLLMRWAEPPPPAVYFRIGIVRALEPEALRLGPGRPQAPFYGHDARPGLRDTLEDAVGPVDISLGEQQAGQLAALLLRRFYEFFGMGIEAIPHLSSDGSFNPESLVGKD